MSHFRSLAGMGIPALVLGLLTGYADYVEGTGQIPFGMILTLTILMGFLYPKGGWRWTILIGAGVHLAHITGNLIDSTPSREFHQLTFLLLLRDLIPALIGTYSGIFIHRWFYEGDEWDPKGSISSSDVILQGFEAIAEAQREKQEATAIALLTKLTISEPRPEVQQDQRRKAHSDIKRYSKINAAAAPAKLERSHTVQPPRSQASHDSRA